MKNLFHMNETCSGQMNGNDEKLTLHTRTRENDIRDNFHREPRNERNF